MYLKPLSTASVATTDPCGSFSASRSAPTTFAPLEVPAKMPSSCARRTVIASASLSSIAQTSSTFAGSQSGGTIPDQPCMANEPLAPPVIAADPAGSSPTTRMSAFRSFSAAATPSSALAVPIPWTNAATLPSVCSQISRPSAARWPGMAYGLLNWSVAYVSRMRSSLKHSEMTIFAA